MLKEPLSFCQPFSIANLVAVVVLDYCSKILFVEQTALEDEDHAFLMAREQACLLFRIIKVTCPSEEEVRQLCYKSPP